MDAKQPRVHFYHADASAIGGRIDRPLEQIVPVQAPLSLPAVGGHAFARSEKFSFQGLLSFEVAETHVSGSFNETNGSWTTQVSAAIENLNVLNVVTADRVVAQISTEHPAKKYTPKVSFVGTQFVNLRIGGCKVDPILNLGFCDQGAGEHYPDQACIQNSDFLTAVDKQYYAMRSKQEGAGNSEATAQEKSSTPEWLSQLYPVPQSQMARERGMVLCSLVQKVHGECPWKPYGHVIVIPEFGKIFLGELLLDHDSFHLIMIRLELGCPVGGVLGIGDTRTNGTTVP
jgi:hypothetical protein